MAAFSSSDVAKRIICKVRRYLVQALSQLVASLLALSHLVASLVLLFEEDVVELASGADASASCCRAIGERDRSLKDLIVVTELALDVALAFGVLAFVADHAGGRGDAGDLAGGACSALGLLSMDVLASLAREARRGPRRGAVETFRTLLALLDADPSNGCEGAGGAIVTRVVRLFEEFPVRTFLTC